MKPGDLLYVKENIVCAWKDYDASGSIRVSGKINKLKCGEMLICIEFGDFDRCGLFLSKLGLVAITPANLSCIKCL